MNPVCPAILFIAIVGFIPLARGQAVLDKTSLGKSQSDERDLANSLVTAPQKYGKGEKKSQVSAAELKSKSIKDATFGGSLLNIGIDPAAPKLDASKEHSAPSEGQSSARTVSTEHVSSASKQSEATEGSSASNQSEPGEADSTFSSLSQTATLADHLSQSGATVAPASEPRTSSNSSASKDNQKKEQGEAEKPSTTSSTEKPSTNKPDGDR